MSDPLQDVKYEAYSAWKNPENESRPSIFNQKLFFDGLFFGIHGCGWKTKETKTKFMVPDGKRS